MPQGSQPAPQSPKPNLVLGTAWGLRPEDLNLFARSLRRVAPDVEVVLIAKDTSPEAQRLAEQERVDLVPLNSCFYSMGKPAAKRVRNQLGLRLVKILAQIATPLLRIGYESSELAQLKREIFKLVIQTSSSRYLHYLDFLKNRQDRYGKIMLTDVRDVCFQANPFEHIPSDKLWLFEEPLPATLGSDGRNRKWVQATFGSTALKSMADKPVICSGVTFGGFSNVFGYLEAMEPELISRTPTYIADQGIHNAMAYLGKFSHLGTQILPNETGPVLTMGLMKMDRIRVSESGAVVNARGEAYPVLHQFDRHPWIVELMQKQNQRF